MIAGRLPVLRRVSHAIARNDGRCRWSKCACETSTASIAGNSRSFNPGRRSRLSTKIQRAKLGSTNVPAPALEEEAGMSDEGYAQLAAAGEYGFTGDAGARRQSGVPHQRSKLPGFTTNCDS